MRLGVIPLFLVALILAALASASVWVPKSFYDPYLNTHINIPFPPLSLEYFPATASANVTTPYGRFMNDLTPYVANLNRRAILILYDKAVLKVGDSYYPFGLGWRNPAYIEVVPQIGYIFVIYFNFESGGVEWRAVPYTRNNVNVYFNSSVRAILYYSNDNLPWLWNAFGLNATPRAHVEVLLVRGCTSLRVYAGNRTIYFGKLYTDVVTADVGNQGVQFVIMYNVTWTRLACRYVKEITPLGYVYDYINITASNYNAIFMVDPQWRAQVWTGGTTAAQTSTTTTTQSPTTSVQGPGQPIGTAPPQQWTIQRPDGAQTTVGYGAATLYSNRIYVYLYDVWGNVVTDASVTCGNVKASFNNTNYLYYCDGITSTVTVTVSHPRYYGVKFNADPGRIYVVTLYPSTSGIPNELTPSGSNTAYLVLTNPSPKTVQAEVRTPSGCVFNLQVGSTTLSTYTLQPYSSLMVTVNGPSSGCDSGAVEVYADGKKVWSATWGSIKGTTQYVNVASDIKYPVDVYGPGGSYIGNVTGMPSGWLSGNWTQWLIIIGAAFIILVLLAIVLSRR